MFRISHLFSLLLAVNGCSQSDNVVSSKSQTKSDRESSHISSSRLIRDLGSIRVNSQHTVIFNVKNDTDTPWTIDQFDTTCVCTVTKASASIIKPHSTESIDVKYRAPGKYSDEYRLVGLKFKEEGTPYLSLVVKANVRPAADAYPAEINVQRMARGQTLDSFFEVRNYSESDWAKISAWTDASWVKTECISIPVNGQPGSPRQKWRVLLKGNTKSLIGGSQKFVVHVISGEGGEPLNVPVVLEMPRPVEAIPDQIFIPSAEKGKIVKHKVSLRFANKQAFEDEKKIEVVHNLPDQFKITCKRSSDLSWEICTEWNTTEVNSGIVNGHLTLKFSRSEEIPDIKIPVYARVSQK